ncbi:MAG TPA: hypothetical protein VGH49_13585, partial [Xanthobacteraceae bacterium]
KDILDKLHDEIARAIASEEVQQKLRTAGVEPKIGSAEDVKAMLAFRIPQWAEVIKSAGIRVDER